MDGCRLLLEMHPLAEGHHAVGCASLCGLQVNYEDLSSLVGLRKAQGTASVKQFVKSRI